MASVKVLAPVSSQQVAAETSLAQCSPASRTAARRSLRLVLALRWVQRSLVLALA